MAKNRTTKIEGKKGVKRIEKPKEILELEKVWEVELIVGKFNGVYFESGHVGLDNMGNVIAFGYSDNPVKDLSLLSKFTYLEYLQISNCGLKDVSALKNLSNLKQLYLNANRIEDISSLAPLQQLQKLSIAHNPILNFSPLKKLKNLDHLDIEETNAIALEAIRELTNLKTVFLERNSIQNISVLVSLKNIERLWVQGNKINDISPLEELPNVADINVSNNNINYVSPQIAAKFDFDLTAEAFPDERGYVGINLSHNPLTFPPHSVIALGKVSTKSYYDNSETFGHQPISEARVLLLGYGSAGKSSLRNRILYNSFDAHETQTNGIRIDDWHLPHTDGRDLKFNIWDFGGQEVQHAVHKFFLSSGCMYVLVLDNRKEEEPEYWLQHIESFGGSSPVLIVFNKHDQNNAERVDRKFLKDKYPNIVGFHNISCKTGTGISEFIDKLKEEVVKLNMVNEEFPKNWLAVKKELEKNTTESNHYLVYDAYTEICKRNNVTEEKVQKLLLEYLSSIGTITWFGDTFLQHMHILNPAWITQGVYRIVTGNKTNVLKGHINVSDFKELLYPVLKADFEYEPKYYSYIIALMRKFELCYYNEDTQELLVPSAFGKEPRIEYSQFKGEGLRMYVLQFKDYLPVSVVHQFISRNIESAYEHNYWYQGIVLQDNVDSTDGLAMVQYDKDAKQILIRIKGENKLGLWEHIRREIKTITGRYAKIVYREQIAIEGNLDYVVDYIDLINHLRAGKKNYFHSKQIRDYMVADLIGWFEPKEDTLQKIKFEGLSEMEHSVRSAKQNVVMIQNILENKIESRIENRVNVEVNIDVQFTREQAGILKEEANYLLHELKGDAEDLKAVLKKVVELADDLKKAKTKEDITEQGWRKKLKGMMTAVEQGKDLFKNITEGTEAGIKIITALKAVSDFLQMNAPGSGL